MVNMFIQENLRMFYFMGIPSWQLEHHAHSNRAISEIIFFMKIVINNYLQINTVHQFLSIKCKLRKYEFAGLTNASM